MEYDLIIIGAGPAGLTAAIYAARYKLNMLLISKDRGGLATIAHRVCNYPSYNEIKGFDLMEKFVKQVENLNVPIEYDEVKKIIKVNDKFEVHLHNKKYIAKNIIFSGGTIRKKLNVPGEAKLIGKGVSYCATCDGPFFKNKTVAVIGGSDAALTAALLMTEYAKEVYIIHRGNEFTKAEPIWIEIVEKEKKIKKIFNEDVKEIIGDKKVEEIKLNSGKILKLDGVFIEIGSVPQIDFLATLNLNTTKSNYIITDKNQNTNVPGFFAAGDITNNSLKQIVTAAGEGATAAYQVYNQIKIGGNKK